MSLFDQSIVIQSALANITNAIAQLVKPNEQLITVVDDKLLILLRDNIGYVHLLHTKDDNNTTQVRLIVDTPQHIREAFRGKKPTDALSALLSTSTSPDSAISPAAHEHLNLLQQMSEQGDALLAAKQETASSEIAAMFQSVGLANVKKNYRAPWNPDGLAGYVFFLTIIGAGIIFGINWRRLHKPEWMWRTIIASIVVPLAMIGILIALFSLSLPPIMMMVGFFLLTGINYGFIFGLWFLQRGAYKAWSQTGKVESLNSHTYNFKRALTGGAAIAIGITVFGSGYTVLSSRPNTFENDELTVTYPTSWIAHDFRQLPQCQGSDFECIMVLTDSQFGYTAIYLSKTKLAQSMTPKEIELLTREFLENQIAATHITVDTVQVDGIPGVQRTYEFPSPTRENTLSYGMQIILVDGMTYYEVNVESLTRAIFEERQQNIDEFIAGIDFKFNDA